MSEQTDGYDRDAIRLIGEPTTIGAKNFIKILRTLPHVDVRTQVEGAEYLADVIVEEEEETFGGYLNEIISVLEQVEDPDAEVEVLRLANRIADTDEDVEWDQYGPELVPILERRGDEFQVLLAFHALFCKIGSKSPETIAPYANNIELLLRASRHDTVTMDCLWGLAGIATTNPEIAVKYRDAVHDAMRNTTHPRALMNGIEFFTTLAAHDPESVDKDYLSELLRQANKLDVWQIKRESIEEMGMLLSDQPTYANELMPAIIEWVEKEPPEPDDAEFDGLPDNAQELNVSEEELVELAGFSDVQQQALVECLRVAEHQIEVFVEMDFDEVKLANQLEIVGQRYGHDEHIDDFGKRIEKVRIADEMVMD